MTTKIEIQAPIDKVFKLFIDKDKFPEWKIGFINYEPISGLPGEEGAITRLTYKNYCMIETILKKNIPGLYTAAYEFVQNNRTMMKHTAVHKFTPLTTNKTAIEVASEVTEVNNFMMKIFMKIFPNAGKKQLEDQMKHFKILAEKNKIAQ